VGAQVARQRAIKERKPRVKITPESTITVTCKCAECKGTGVVSSPIWMNSTAR
jgi:hypothetical protein